MTLMRPGPVMWALAACFVTACGSSGKYTTPTTTTYATSENGDIAGSSADGYSQTYAEASPVRGQTEVVYEPAPSYIVIVAPPPPQTVIVVPPPPPYDGAIWVRGHWRWNGHDYVWLTGHYIPPRAGYTFVQPRWEYRDQRYVYVRGYYRPYRSTVRRHTTNTRRAAPPARRTTVVRPTAPRTPSRPTVVRTPRRR